jgi:PST family polysaccharide transporter
MIKHVKRIIKTDLIKTSFFTSISVFVRIIAAFVLNKVVAIYIGPIGVALVGQFNNFFGVINTISTAGINIGVVKYIAEARNDNNEIRKVITTSFFVVVACSLAVAIALISFSGFFSNLIFKSQEYRYVLLLLAVSVLFSALNILLLAILNGYKEIAKYASSNIISSVFVLLLSTILGFTFKLKGVLIALIAGQSVVFFITLIFVIKSQWFRWSHFTQYFDKKVLRSLSEYSLMTFASTLTLPLSLLIIRNYIGNNLSWEEAGYWQGVYTISEVYLMFITSSLSVYYLPRLAELSSATELKHEIISTARIVMPIVIVMAILIYMLREPLTLILFSGKFSAMLPLFKYQLIGDVIKIAGYLLAYQMVAKSMTKAFVIMEIISSLSFVVLVYVFVRLFGLQGTTMAFCANYVFYVLYLLVYFRKQFFLK